MHNTSIPKKCLEMFLLAASVSIALYFSLFCLRKIYIDTIQVSGNGLVGYFFMGLMLMGIPIAKSLFGLLPEMPMVLVIVPVALTLFVALSLVAVALLKPVTIYDEGDPHAF